MALENTAIQDKLVATFGEAVYISTRKRYFSFEINADQNKAIILS
jgi:NADH-quinone oxidoreductase subunit C